MEKIFSTPKRKSSYRSDSEPSPEDKRLKESDSSTKISSDEDEVMEVLGLKTDLVLSKLSNLKPVSRKPRKLFGPGKPFSVHLKLCQNGEVYTPETSCM